VPRKPKVETVDCQGTEDVRCDATWQWVEREAGDLIYRKPSNGLRGARHVPLRQEPVEAVTTDDYLWLFECPFCGYAESDPIEPEE
jgi:hypothetical protein